MAESGRATVTRADVARESNLSVAVVSYVVNNGPRPVAVKTRQRVLDAIERTGYRPNGVARALAAGSTFTLALIVPDIANEFFAELACAVEQSARRAGRTVLLGNSEGDRDTEQALLETFLQRQIDGVVLASEAPDDVANLFATSKSRVVFLGHAPNSSPSTSIAVDNEAGAFVATKHLLEHGYEQLGMIAGPAGDQVATARLAGWHKAIEEASLDFAAFVHRPFTIEGGYLGGLEILGGTRRPRAIFAASDRQAIGLLRAAADRNLHVPSDLAIVTFDGSAASQYAVPSLTTIAQPISIMAELAVRELLYPDDHATRHVLPVDLVVRRSCGCTTTPH